MLLYTCTTHCRTEERLAQKKEKEQEDLKKNLVDPFEEEEEEGEESDELMDMDDSRLGPPFGVVLNGHSLVCILVYVLYSIQVRVVVIYSVALACKPKL